jgi:hypothetical protein
MCPHCGAELERIPTGTPGCYDVYCLAECGYSAHRITTEGLEAEASSPEVHPLVDGRRACYGDAEVETCDECARPFLAEETCYSRWTGKPICPACKQVQDAER